ncbi:hypothetical protein PC128_g17904 [Phytophthora cactorum]|nr:hypothetical protein PC128_g17904 [Phytophthora cactorum]
MGDLVYFYAVTSGRCSGIFTSWDEVLDATVGYPGAKSDRFSTLEEAERFMREQDVGVRSNLRPLGWTGPAYAVAVGRRMGVFKTHQEALRQTQKYSGNSLKKFSSCEKAVEFLDHHDWRKIPSDDENGPNNVEVVKIFDELAAEESLDEDVLDVTTSEERTESHRNTANLDLSSKHERDEDDIDHNNEVLRPTQRRKTDNSLKSKPKERHLVVYCVGNTRSDAQGNTTIASTCMFKTHPEWNVKKIVGPNISTTQASLMAVSDMLERVALEDPGCDVSVSILTNNLPMHEILRKCSCDEFKSCDGNKDLLESITKKKGSRTIRVIHLFQVLEGKMPFNDDYDAEMVEATEDIEVELSSENDVTTAEERNKDHPETVNHAKRGRIGDSDQNDEVQRPTQRRNTDKSLHSMEKKLHVFCFGCHNKDPQGNLVMLSTCSFPTHPQWDVMKTLGSNTTATEAGLMAVLDTLERVAQEDPGCEWSVSIYTFNGLVCDILDRCARVGYKSCDEYQELLERITREKGNRTIRVVVVGGAFTWE